MAYPPQTIKERYVIFLHTSQALLWAAWRFIVSCQISYNRLAIGSKTFIWLCQLSVFAREMWYDLQCVEFKYSNLIYDDIVM